MTTSVLIDCDPGVDDAFALALAFAARDKLDVLGITAVAGNRPLEFTALNARRICAIAGVTDVPVFAGCPRPIIRPDGELTPVHGHDGLGDTPGLPAPVVPLQPRHAVDFIIETLMSRPEGSVTLCAIGPMTNIATAIIMEPRIVPRIRELVFMGGSVSRISAVRVSDFNFFFDPHAAHIVTSAGIPQVMFSIDATEQVTVPEDVLRRLEARPGSASDLLARMMRNYAKGDPRLHDVCCIAWLLWPELFQSVPGHIAVEHASELTRGMTVARVSPRKIAGFQPNARIITTIDTAALFDRMLARLDSL